MLAEDFFSSPPSDEKSESKIFMFGLVSNALIGSFEASLGISSSESVSSLFLAAAKAGVEVANMLFRTLSSIEVEVEGE